MTPGPWRYDSGKIWTPRGWWVANVYEDMEEDIKGANGLVLAAAPDLLDALQELCEYAEISNAFKYGVLPTSFVREIAFPAIAKARGEK